MYSACPPAAPMLVETRFAQNIERPRRHHSRARTRPVGTITLARRHNVRSRTLAPHPRPPRGAVIRSRAVNFPFSCCFAMFFLPPPSLILSRRCRTSLSKSSDAGTSQDGVHGRIRKRRRLFETLLGLLEANVQ